MAEYIIKSMISLAVLLVLYHLLLEREKMHLFNRFYLLGSLTFSLALPFISIPVYTEARVVFLTQPAHTETVTGISKTVTAETSYWPYAVIFIYIIGFTISAARLFLNIRELCIKSRRNTTVPYKEAKLVLLEEDTVPFTFLHYIFISRKEYENRLIEEELTTHELVHVNQKHTLDVIIIELMRTIFWFNPILYYYKKAIQLNHEFLADETVVKRSGDVVCYQNLLLKRTTNTPHYLTSNLTFLITKKRFIMMTKKTGKSKAAVLKLLLLPVIGTLTMLLCTETIAQEKLGSSKADKSTIERLDTYYSGVQFVIDDKANNIKVDKPYEQLTEEEKEKYNVYAPEPYSIISLRKSDFEKLKDKKSYTVRIDSKDVDNTVLDQYKPSDFAYYSAYSTAKDAHLKDSPQTWHYQLFTLNYYKKHLEGTNNHYPGKVYEMTIIKEFKDGKVVAEYNKP